MAGGFLPLTYNARIMRRTSCTYDHHEVFAPSGLWLPIREEEPRVGLELCRAMGWRAGIREEEVARARFFCWHFRGYHDRDGYARINLFGASWMVSRVWAGICYGALNADEDAHHTCTKRWCVNPAHIEPLHRGRHHHLHGYRRSRHAQEYEVARAREDDEEGDEAYGEAAD